MRGNWLAGIEVGRTSPLDELRKAEQRDPDRLLLRWREGEWSVRQFARSARLMARGVRLLGVQPGDRVSIVAGNSEWYAALSYGIYMAGAIESPVNTELRGPLLKHVIEDADPAALLVEPDYLEQVRSAEVSRHLTVFDEAWRASLAGLPESEEAQPAAEDVAAIIHTSGTTGPSKGVMLSHGYFANCADVWCNVCEIGPEDVTYWVFPFSHVDAHIQIAMAIERGAVLAFVPRFSRRRFWDDIRSFDASVFAALGWMLSILAEDGPPERRHELRLNRGVCCPVSQDNYEFFEDKLGVHLLEIYGQTEADSPCFGTRSKRRRGSGGWPCSGFDVEVHDAEGRSLNAGQRGEIVYRPGAANMIASGYWRRPEATLAAWHDLWFHSGDLGHFDEDGFLWFDGRLKDVIRCRGENVSAFELESTLRDAPGVYECVALPVPAERGGEEDIRVLIVPSEGTEFDVEAFVSFCESHLARFAVPRYAELVEESALTRSAGSGAVQKHKLPAEVGPDAIDLLAFQTARSGSPA